MATKPLKTGATHEDLWDVPEHYPLRRTLEVLFLESGEWTPLGTLESRPSVRVEPFDALELELAALWI
jgi:hypothetical protein